MFTRSRAVGAGVLAASLAISATMLATAADAATGTNAIGATATGTTATAAARGQAEPELQTFTTQNGTATFSVPVDWAVADTSHLDVTPAGYSAWVNELAITGDGVRLLYRDGPKTGYELVLGPDQWGAVDARELPDGTTAQSFWALEAGRYAPHAMLTRVETSGFGGAGILDAPVMGESNDGQFAFELDLTDASGAAPTFATRGQAVAFLRDPAVARALDVIETLERTGLDWHTFPEGVEPTDPGLIELPFTAHPEWTREDSAYEFFDEQGEPYWVHVVRLSAADGAQLIYSLRPAYEHVPGEQPGEWTGEVVATTVDGFLVQAAHRHDPVAGPEHYAGIDLTATAEPSPTPAPACDAVDCHAITGFPAAPFDSAEAAQAWLDGDTAAQLVAMMASFQLP